MRRTMFFSTTALLLAVSSGAFAAGSVGAPIDTSAMRNVARSGKSWIFEGNLPTGQVVSVPAGPKLRMQSASFFEAHARATLAALADEERVDARRALELRDVLRFADGDVVVRFRERVAGVPVISGGAVVRLDSQGAAHFATRTPRRFEGLRTIPALSADQARNAARDAIHKGGPLDLANLAIARVFGRDALVWVVDADIPAGIPTRPRVLVDAQTGEVLRIQDRVTYMQNAKVYAANPISTPDLALRRLFLPSAADELTNPFLTTFNCVDRKSVKQVNFGQTFDVHVCDLEGGIKANADGDFDYAPNDTVGDPASQEDAFANVSMFYHAGRAFQFFRDLQGDPEAQVIKDKPLPLIANLRLPPGLSNGDFSTASDKDKPLDPYSNAFFSPGGQGDLFGGLYGIAGGALWFGQGPRRDYAYDGDVVYHEFTHAVVDHTLQLDSLTFDQYGLSVAPGAMNEGLADYFSSAIAGDPNVGEYASKDLSENLTVIRTLKNDDTCPATVVGEVHADSTLFSGGLWAARMSLPEASRPEFDRAIYKAMMSNAGEGDLSYDELTQFFLTSLVHDLPAGAAALEAEMKKRGVLPKCTRIVDYQGTPVVSPMYGDRRLRFASFGRSSTGIAVVPGILQVHVKLPPGTKRVTLTFDGKSSGGSGLGGGGNPFVPVVLARFETPIAWSSSNGKIVSAQDATTVLPRADESETPFETSLDVLDGAANLYVQIANKGDDGSYDSLDFKLISDPVPREFGDAGVGKDAGGLGNSADPSGSSLEGAGCSCHTQPKNVEGSLAPMLAAGLAFLCVRRRRNSHDGARSHSRRAR